MRTDHERQISDRYLSPQFSPETYSALKADGFLEDGQLRRDLVPHLVRAQRRRTIFEGRGAAAWITFFGALFKKWRRI